MSGTALDRRSTLLVLACGAFASQASIRICDAMLPAFARDFGGAPTDYAMVVTAFTVAYGLFQLLYGPMGDRYGKLRVITVAAAVAALGSLACALAADRGMLTLVRFATGAACAALIPLSLAWIGDHVDYGERQQVLARFMAGATAGAVFGQVSGGLFADTLGWRPAFAVLAATLALASVALYRMPRPATAPASVHATGLRAFAGVLRIGHARLVLAIVFAEGALVFGAMAFAPTYLHVEHGLTVWQAGLAAAGFGLGGLAFALTSPWLVPRLGQRGTAALGGTLLLAGLTSLGGPQPGIEALKCAVGGAGFFSLHNTLQTVATQMAPQARGTAIAAFASALFFGQTAGVAVVAAMVRHLPFGRVFVAFGVLVALLAAVVAAFVARPAATSAAR